MKILKADFNFKIQKWLEIFGNYTYNDSKISSFSTNPELVGKKLIFTPKYKANAGISLKIAAYEFSVIYHYISTQYTNNENSSVINSYNTADFKVSIELLKNLDISYSIQNIFDYQYLIYSNRLSLGRFMTFDVRYKF